MQFTQERGSFPRPWVGFVVSMAVSFTATCFPAQGLWAQDLSQAIEAAKSELTSVTADQVASARGELDRAIAGVDQIMSPWEEETRWGWEDYLYWLDVKETLASDEVDLGLLRKTNANLRRKHEGLELPAFLALREALQTYIELESFVRQPDQGAVYVRLLDELSSALQAVEADPTADHVGRLGRVLGTLEAAGQASEVIAQVRAKFGNANLVAHVSSQFISKNATQPVEDTRPVNEEILGSHQTGTATTVGSVRLKTVPNSDVAEIAAILEGTTESQTVGRRPVGKLGTVVINSTSTSDVKATKQILIDDGELTSTPACATAKTDSKILSVCAPKLISKLATRQVQRSKPKAEAIAASRLAKRLEASFNDRVAEALDQANENFTKEVHLPLIRLDAHPDQIGFSTTADALAVAVKQASSYQVAAATEPPALDASADAALVIHQTAVNNLAEAVFGGKTITDRLAAEWIEIANQGDLPDEFRISPDQPWSITLATYLPITVDFGESQVTVRIRGSRFAGSAGEVRDRIEIQATYAIEKTLKGVRLTRVGEVELSYPGKSQLTVEQTAVKAFLLEKFKALFKDEVETMGVQFPGRFSDKAPMQLSKFDMVGGWLTLAWQQAAEANEEVALAGGRR